MIKLLHLPTGRSKYVSLIPRDISGNILIIAPDIMKRRISSFTYFERNLVMAICKFIVPGESWYNTYVSIQLGDIFCNIYEYELIDDSLTEAEYIAQSMANII